MVFFFSSQMFELVFKLVSIYFAVVSKARAAGQYCAKRRSFHLLWLLISMLCLPSVLKLSFGAVP